MLGKRFAVGANLQGFEAMRGANHERCDSAASPTHTRAQRRQPLRHQSDKAEPQRHLLEDAAAPQRNRSNHIAGPIYAKQL
jgi:hypothetical protein